MVDFGADFSRFTQSFSRLIRDINGEKNISLMMIFFTVSFSRFYPLSRYGQESSNTERPSAEPSFLLKKRPGLEDPSNHNIRAFQSTANTAGSS